MISSRNRDGLPSIHRLRQLTQSIALLDAILMPEWEYRYYSFNRKWGEADLASMRNGSGDEFFIVFDKAGAIIGGWDHESPMVEPYVDRGTPWPGITDCIPAAFSNFLNQSNFPVQYMTFCIWCLAESTDWQTGPVTYPAGPDPDGSEGLLYILDGNAATYVLWAEGYYEQDVDAEAVRSIYEQVPLTKAILSRLNPELTIQELSSDLDEIGYPLGD